MENNKKTEKVSYYVERRSALVQSAAIIMLLSAVFRVIGCWGLWNDKTFAVTQIVLPLVCNLMFVLLILTLGKRALWTTALPVLLGVVFFIIKSFQFDSIIHTVLCIFLYLVVAVLYTGTVFGAVRTKWLLVPLFGLPFLYHVFVEDIAAIRSAVQPSFQAGMQEISVLCVMLSLLLISLAMKKNKPESEQQELPKMKAPKVLTPEKAEPAEEKPQEETAPSADTAPTDVPGDKQ